MEQPLQLPHEQWHRAAGSVLPPQELSCSTRSQAEPQLVPTPGERGLVWPQLFRLMAKERSVGLDRCHAALRALRLPQQ